MKTKRSIAWIVGSALAALTLAGCFGTTQPGATGSAPPVTGPQPIVSQGAPQEVPPELQTPFLSPITEVSAPPERRPGSEEPVLLYVENPEVGKSYSKFTNTPSEHATEVESRYDIEDQHVAELDGLEVVGPHELRVYFSGGMRECFAERIALEEGKGVVKVAVVSGWVGGDQACRLPAFPYYITVKTEQDLTKIVVVEAAADDVFLRKGV